MNKNKNIDTKLALVVTEMFNSELNSFLNLISEINDVCFKGKSSESWVDFYNCVKKYYVGHKNNNGKVFNSIVCLKGTRNYEYKKIISRYNFIFDFLFNNGVLDKWLNIMAFSSSRKCFIDFIEDFLKNYDLCENIFENLSAIDMLKIESFEYDKDASLDLEYTISIGNSFYNSGQSSVRGVYSDGEKNWHPIMEIGKYSFDLKNANYVIKYSKNTISSNGVSMVCNNLFFDFETLPTYSELYDKNTLPNLDYSQLSVKTKKFNSICSSFEIKEDINTLIKKIEMFLSSCDASLLDKNQLEDLRRQVILLNEPYLLFESVSDSLLTQYNEDGKLNKEKINSYLSKRKSKKN